MSSSGVVPGITDVSCPVLNHLGVAVAALTVPLVGYSSSTDADGSAESVVVPALKVAAREISRAAGGGPPEPA